MIKKKGQTSYKVYSEPLKYLKCRLAQKAIIKTKHCFTTYLNTFGECNLKDDYE